MDLDRYYTPVNLAENLIAESVSSDVNLCVDTTCGSGNLLLAADRVFKNTKCVGLDRDRSTITMLKKQYPEWILSVADLMNESSYTKTSAVNQHPESDLLLLNPPFSHGRTKSVEVSYRDNLLKASVAMAHILTSFSLFKPTSGALIIVPESVLYSETDELGRKFLRQDYSIDLVKELDTSTFSGARVRSTAIRISPGRASNGSQSATAKYKEKIPIKVTRGALPHFQRSGVTGLDSVPYIHSTNIRDVLLMEMQRLEMTEMHRKGRVSGVVILLPRVGVPSKELIHPVYLRSSVQLSDCVIALHFKSLKLGRLSAERIRLEYDSLISEYRGTGARYITMNRLYDWLKRVSFSI